MNECSVSDMSSSRAAAKPPVAAKNTAEFVWELTKTTIHLPLGCLQGGLGFGIRDPGFGYPRDSGIRFWMGLNLFESRGKASRGGEEDSRLSILIRHVRIRACSPISGTINTLAQ